VFCDALSGGKVSKVYLFSFLFVLALSEFVVAESNESEAISIRLTSKRKPSALVKNPSKQALGPNTIQKKSSEGSLDLSSELSESVAEGQKIGNVPNSSKKDVIRKKKPKKLTRVESGPTETVQVPDNMDWDHNKKTQNQQIKKLKKELDGDLPNDIDE